jgi:hypothetical protein
VNRCTNFGGRQSWFGSQLPLISHVIWGTLLNEYGSEFSHLSRDNLPGRLVIKTEWNNIGKACRTESGTC